VPQADDDLVALRRLHVLQGGPVAGHADGRKVQLAGLESHARLQPQLHQRPSGDVDVSQPQDVAHLVHHRRQQVDPPVRRTIAAGQQGTVLRPRGKLRIVRRRRIHEPTEPGRRDVQRDPVGSHLPDDAGRQIRNREFDPLQQVQGQLLGPQGLPPRHGRIQNGVQLLLRQAHARACRRLGTFWSLQRYVKGQVQPEIRCGRVRLPDRAGCRWYVGVAEYRNCV